MGTNVENEATSLNHLRKTDLTLTIRSGQRADLDTLAELEMDANWALIEAGASISSSPSATPRHLMEQALSEGLVFVGTDDVDFPLGFLAGSERDGGLYIGEIDVWRRWQGNGIGRALVQHALAEARRRNLWGAMLTTDRFAPFNMPFYARLGFVEIAQDLMPPSLASVIQDEIMRGYDPGRRVGMLYSFVKSA